MGTASTFCDCNNKESEETEKKLGFVSTFNSMLCPLKKSTTSSKTNHTFLYQSPSLTVNDYQKNIAADKIIKKYREYKQKKNNNNDKNEILRNSHYSSKNENNDSFIADENNNNSDKKKTDNFNYKSSYNNQNNKNSSGISNFNQIKGYKRRFWHKYIK